MSQQFHFIGCTIELPLIPQHAWSGNRGWSSLRPRRWRLTLWPRRACLHRDYSRDPPARRRGHARVHRGPHRRQAIVCLRDKRCGISPLNRPAAPVRGDHGGNSGLVPAFKENRKGNIETLAAFDNPRATGEAQDLAPSNPNLVEMVRGNPAQILAERDLNSPNCRSRV